MQPMALKINHLLGDLEEEDYDKVVSYIEFLIGARKKEKIYAAEILRYRIELILQAVP